MAVMRASAKMWRSQGKDLPIVRSIALVPSRSWMLAPFDEGSAATAAGADIDFASKSSFGFWIDQVY